MRETISRQKSRIHEAMVDFIENSHAKSMGKKIDDGLYVYELNFNNDAIIDHFNNTQGDHDALQYLQDAYPDGLELWYKKEGVQTPKKSFYETQFKTALDSIYESSFSLLLEQAGYPFSENDAEKRYKFNLYADALHHAYQTRIESFNDQFSYIESDSNTYDFFIGNPNAADSDEIKNAIQEVTAYQAHAACLLGAFSGENAKETPKAMVDAISKREQSFMHTDFLLQDDLTEQERIYFDAAQKARDTFKADLMTITLSHDEETYKISVYDRHVLLTQAQQNDLNLNESEKRKYYPTATAHNPDYLLPNSARGYHATYCPETGSHKLISNLNRHGSSSPNEMYREEIKEMGGRAKSTLRTYRNMQQHLMNCRLDKIRALLESHEIPYTNEEVLMLAQEIGDVMNEGFIAKNQDYENKRQNVLDQVISQSELDESIKNVLTDHIDSVLMIYNVHVHLITATGLQNFGKGIINYLTDQDRQELQGRDCRLAQYATQYISPDSTANAGYWELILPVNGLKEDTTKSRRNNLAGLIFMFKALWNSTELSKECSIESIMGDEYQEFLSKWDDTRHFARRYIERVESAYEGDELSVANTNSFLEGQRKIFKDKEIALHTSARTCYQTMLSYLNSDEFKVLVAAEDITLNQRAALVAFQHACSLYGPVSKEDKTKNDQYNGFMQVYLMTALNLMGMSSSFGCKSANDRAYFIALLYFTIATKIDAFISEGNASAWKAVFDIFPEAPEDLIQETQKHPFNKDTLSEFLSQLIEIEPHELNDAYDRAINDVVKKDQENQLTMEDMHALFNSFFEEGRDQIIKESQQQHFLDISAHQTKYDRSAAPKTSSSLLSGVDDASRLISLEHLAAHKRGKTAKTMDAQEDLFHNLLHALGGNPIETALLDSLLEWNAFAFGKADSSRVNQTRSVFVENWLHFIETQDVDIRQTCLADLVAHFSVTLNNANDEYYKIRLVGSTQKTLTEYYETYSEVLEEILVSHINFQIQEGILDINHPVELIDFIEDLAFKTNGSNNLSEIKDLLKDYDYGYHLSDDDKKKVSTHLLAKIMRVAIVKNIQESELENPSNEKGLLGRFSVYASTRRSSWRTVLYYNLAHLLDDTNTNQKIDDLLVNNVFKEIIDRKKDRPVEVIFETDEETFKEYLGGDNNDFFTNKLDS